MADPGLMFACFGCCCGHSEANVIFLYLHGRPLYFRRINSPELFDAVLSYARVAADVPGAALPPELAECSFSWTGGGVGAEP